MLNFSWVGATLGRRRWSKKEFHPKMEKQGDSLVMVNMGRIQNNVVAIKNI